MNKLRRPSALGLPFHGKVVGGVLTTTAGPVSILDTLGGSRGSVAFRVPGAPGVSRNAGQQALDLAKGYDWRDYILLIGASRRVSSSGEELGRNKWLYGDPQGRVWVMSAEVVNTSGANCELRITRGALFGRLTVGFDYTITDEIVAIYAFTVSLPAGYSGGTTAADIAAGLTVDNAAAIWPDVNGAEVHFHLLTTRTDVYDAIDTATWSGTLVAVPVLIVTVNLSGNGDPNANGVGISGAFSNASDYDSRVDVSQSSQPFVYDPPYTPGTLCFTSIDNPIPTPPPTGAGQNTTGNASLTWNNAGLSTSGLSLQSDESEFALLRTQSGDVKTTTFEQSANFKSLSLGTGSATATSNWVSEFNSGTGQWQWDFVDYTNESVTNSAVAVRYQDFTGNFNVNIGAIDVGMPYRDYTGETANTCEPCADEGVPNQQTYFDLPINIECNITQQTPAENTIDGDTIGYAEGAKNLDYLGEVRIWPGIVEIFMRHENATTQNRFDARHVVLGFPEDGTAPDTICSVEDIDNAVKQTFVVASFGYDPATGESDFTTATGASNAIKYV